MHGEFLQAYKQLNGAQRQAVDTIDGPLLVLAGPGTGKTQLLSTRAANIVAKGDVSANNILCLTYTESGASEMRQRLSRLMGAAGSDVAVFTFHGFGSWLISQYPEHFSRERELSPLDDLTRFQLFESLLQSLPFRHQLAVRDDQERFVRQHAVTEVIRAYKEAGLTPASLVATFKKNELEYAALQPLLDNLFGSTLSAKRLPAIADLVTAFYDASGVGSYSHTLLKSLMAAVTQSEAIGKTAPIGDWRTAHTRIQDGKRVLKSSLDKQLLYDTAKLYKQYQTTLQTMGRFDYEDMILWAIDALQTQTDIKLDVAERFQYIMIDEYQDTNGAQNLLVDAILNANPVDSPNVMVVGDDDQAIMRFQGAELSGMLQFIDRYKPSVIALEDNYRSTQQILDASSQVIAASLERLIDQPLLDTITKKLAAHQNSSKASPQFTTYSSPAAEYYAVSQRISRYLEQGVLPHEIGVIGRKHNVLAEFVPYLITQGITIAYDRRENILEYPAIAQLLRLSEYVSALTEQPQRAARLLPALLADNYWGLEPLDTYNIAAAALTAKQSWLDTMLASDHHTWSSIAEWLIAAGDATLTNNFTQMFDILIGRQVIPNISLTVSPFKQTYETESPEVYAQILSHLICLRLAVLERNPQARSLADMLDVCNQYRQSGIRILDSNPLLRGNAEGVQVMSAHSSKGREFKHVFVLSCTDELWGNRARSNNQRIRLPENLPLYPAGDTPDDKLRLLYVAMTRARETLELSTYLRNDNGRSSTPLGLLVETLQHNDWTSTDASTKDASKDLVPMLETSWHALPLKSDRSLEAILSPLTQNFRLSPTALRDYLDICYAGPKAAIERHILKFPSSYNAHSALGSATHKTLQLAQAAHAKGAPYPPDELLDIFDKNLAASNLSPQELQPALEHGHLFLPTFVEEFSKADFDHIDQTELFVRGESPQLHVPLSGVIDALALDSASLRIIDYKTGKPPLAGWDTKGVSESKKISLHFYRQQLLFYVLLLRGSVSITKPIGSAELIFVEAGADMNTARLAITDFQSDELDRTEQLMHAARQSIVTAKIPDTTSYAHTLAGVIAFENDLLAAYA